MPDIFISYAREDREQARRLADALEQQGWSVWWDPAIPVGKTFDEVIEEALDAAKSVVVLWSKHSVTSRWVRTEDTEGIERGILIPVLIEDVRIPLAFRRIQAADFVDWNGMPTHAPFEKLVVDLTAILGQPRPKKGEVAEKTEAKRQETEQPKTEEKSAESEAEEPGPSTKTQPPETKKPSKLAALHSLLEKQKVIVLASVAAAANVATAVFVIMHEPVPEMVEISPGCFDMGSPSGGGVNDERRPQHRVCVKAFALSKYEVTFEEYDRFAEATNRKKPNDKEWGRGMRPVINVSWNDAKAYTAWLSEQTGKHYRLPTEAEWEYATRAGTTTAYWWGDEIRQDGKVWANCFGCGSKWDKKQTAPIGSFPANPFGLHDTAGNVSERVQDCWHDNYDGAPTDGSVWLEKDNGDCSRRVLRGGAWNVDPGGLHSAARSWSFAGGLRGGTFGFRLAQDL